MAEIKVSALTALTGANVANGDELLINDVGTPNVSKKITADELAQATQFTSRYAPIALGGAFGAWTPTITSGSGTITTVGTVEAQYEQYGKLVVCTFVIPITTKGTAAGKLKMTVPVTAKFNGAAFGAAVGQYRETANSGVTGVVFQDDQGFVSMLEIDGTTVFNADGDTLRGSFIYEAA